MWSQPLKFKLRVKIDDYIYIYIYISSILIRDETFLGSFDYYYQNIREI